MSWDPKRLGFYCSRCDAQINMVFRQERFLGKYGEGKKNSDPYVSVSYCAFFEEDKKKYAYQGAYHYCWDCEKDLSKLIQEFNSKARTNGEGHQGTGFDACGRCGLFTAFAREDLPHGSEERRIESVLGGAGFDP